MNNLIKKEILTCPDYYFDTLKKGLDQRLDKIKLSKDEIEEIVLSKTIKTVRDKILGVFKIGEIVNTILNWSEEVDSDLKDAKKEYLLSLYFDRADEMETALEKIKELLTSPQGNILFNKVLRILDNTPPDIELTNNLARVLVHIVETDFSSMFEDHKFALNQIEMLTPQSITLLSDKNNWKSWELYPYSIVGGKLTTDWVFDFTRCYLQGKGINDENMNKKVSHSMTDLIKNKYVTEKLFEIQPFDPINPITVEIHLSDIGQMIYKYLKV